jgi:hypothetical protein
MRKGGDSVGMGMVGRWYRKWVLGDGPGPDEGGGMAEEKLKYAQPAVEAFTQGVRLDLRARMAADFLRSSPAVRAYAEEAVKTCGDGKVVASATAGFALDLAEALMSESEKRGLVAPMPEGAELDAPTKKQAARMGRFGALQQIGGHREMQEAQAGQVAVAGAGAMPPGQRSN